MTDRQLAIIQQHAGTQTDRSVAEMAGASIKQVRDWRVKNGVPASRTYQKVDAHAYALLKSKRKAKDVADRLGITEGAVWAARHRLRRKEEGE